MVLLVVVVVVVVAVGVVVDVIEVVVLSLQPNHPLFERLATLMPSFTQ